MSKKAILGIVTVFVLAFLSTISIKAGEPLTITTGPKSGNYYKIGLKLAKALGNGTVVTSKGSVENLQRLAKGEAQIGISQKDVYRYMTKKDPSLEGKVTLLGDLSTECVFGVTKEGSFDDDTGLQNEGVKVAVGDPGSGSFVSWQYITGLEPNFKKATPVVTRSVRSALLGVQSGKYDAAVFVLTPSMNSKYIQTVVNNPDLKFFDFTDWDLNDKYKGKPVYEFKKIKVKDGFFGGNKVETICTTASVFVNEKWYEENEDESDTLAEILLNYKKAILP